MSTRGRSSAPPSEPKRRLQSPASDLELTFLKNYVQDSKHSISPLQSIHSHANSTQKRFTESSFKNIHETGTQLPFPLKRTKFIFLRVMVMLLHWAWVLGNALFSCFLGVNAFKETGDLWAGGMTHWHSPVKAGGLEFQPHPR